MIQKILLILFFSLFALTLSAQTRLDEHYRYGPKKEWTEQQVQEWWRWYKNKFFKNSAVSGLRQSTIMNGNKITTEIWNYGSISSPGNRITDIVWEGLGYGYEFGPFVASEIEVPAGSHPDVMPKRDEDGNVVTDEQGNIVYIVHAISDGLVSNGGEVSPDFTERWGLEPLERSDDGINVYLNIEQDRIPTSDDRDSDGDGRPDSWPDDWYNNNLRDYVWPGALAQGATNADKEAFYVVDDRENQEFDYYPYPEDTTRKGLGIEIESRIYQWANPLAEDAIFLIYKITNKGHFDLRKVIFGMWGDPHIGGPSNFDDDWANFDTKLDMTFSWDNDGISDVAGRVPGYMGYKFLESPGLAADNIDNDGDGLIDESWTNGIDDDGDWDIENDDIGVDGVPNTADLGEGDGLPTAGDPFDLKKPGEPNFEFTDIDESDMIGLTSFTQPSFSNLRISEDEKMWARYIQPGTFDTVLTQGDNVFLYGSGQFTLRSIFTVPPDSISEAIKRFSIALIIGEDRNDLVLNAETVQDIYNSGYQFAKPPLKPTITAVPGDRKVTLYWDKVAESSLDPVSREFDFEGYVIYRSTDPGFTDIQTITDYKGTKFLFEPLKTVTGADARFDLKNEYSGVSPIPFGQRGTSYYLGDNTGLRYVFVDSNNVINGQTYFYAVVSYDHGSDSLQIPPSECSKIITFDPTTNTYTTDINTAIVVPRSKTAGFDSPTLGPGINNLSGGVATGGIYIEIVDEMAIEENNTYEISFSDTSDQLEYTVEDKKEVENRFISFYGRAVALDKTNINPESFVVQNQMGEAFEKGRDYQLDAVRGAIEVFDPDSVPGAQMSDNTEYTARYTYFPTFRNTNVDSQLTNTIFDGLQLVIKNEPFSVNQNLTGWSESSQSSIIFKLVERDSAIFYPADYEIEFKSEYNDTSTNGIAINFTVLNVTKNTFNYVAVTESRANRNGRWDPGDNIFILENVTDPEDAPPAKTTWQVISEVITDSTIVPPQPGDKYYIGTFKPFLNGDLFTFTTTSAKDDRTIAKSNLDDIRVVPNPYVATNVLEPKNNVERTERGFRRLYFDKVPAKCTIRIYTMAGELVRVLEHDSTIDDGKVYWDLLTRDNIEVAYGLYFYHVDAPGVGTKIGKFAIIK